MQSFSKFIPYTPDRPKNIDGKNVLFLQDDKGNDWYDVIKLFDESKTLKIGYDDNGRLRTFTTNIHALFRSISVLLNFRQQKLISASLWGTTSFIKTVNCSKSAIIRQTRSPHG
ncbi:hypothetical protein DWS65_02060 [Escherichia coli]|nr:hypothetical protein [Escherichia coli]